MKLFEKGKNNPAYKGRCGNCHKYLGDDKYCRYCGTKAGEGDFLPFDEIVQCVYGPPPTARSHHCNNCGHEWTTNMMIDNQYYCPECGSKDTSVTEKNRSLPF